MCPNGEIQECSEILPDHQMKEPVLWEYLNNSHIKPNDCKYMYFDKHFPNVLESPNKTQM